MKPSAFCFFYDQIPDDARRSFYAAAEHAVRQRKSSFVHLAISGLTADDYLHVLEHVYDDHPEFFFFYPQRSRIVMLPGTVTVVPFYRYTQQEQARYEAELDRAVSAILRECFPDGWETMPQLKREKLLFDWIVRNVEYDHVSYQMAGDPARQEEVSASVGWNAYGAIVRRTAVCEGISCAFKLLCNEVGLPSIVVLGDTKAGRHAWNIVGINEKFYHVDCTWDLHSGISRAVPYARYRYFNLPDRIISANHTAETKFLPACGSLQYNPFRIRGLCAFTPDAALKIAKRMADAGHDRFAIMTVGFRASDVQSDITTQLSHYAGRGLTAYADDSGYFLGFVIDRKGRRK